MEAISVTEARDWISRFTARVHTRRDYLTDLDRQAGDGDYGSNLASALSRASTALDTAPPDSARGVFLAVSDAFLDTGGTSGPLLGIWFRAFAEKAAGDQLTLAALATAATMGTAAVQRLGKAEVGHKTMVDAMVPAARALADAAGQATSIAEALSQAATAAGQAAESTADMRARRGRASYLGDSTRGVTDPGALTIAWFFEAAASPDGTARAGQAAGLRRKVIVTVAPTGGALTKRDTPYVPTQPEEIAEDVRQCFDAGASMAALHARRPDDQATCDPAIYRRMNKLIRERCDIVINNSTGGGFDGDMAVTSSEGLREMAWEQRLRGLDGGADICTLDAVTTYAMPPGGEILMNTPPSRARQLGLLMREKGIKPEWEAFNPAHLAQDVASLIASGLDDQPYLVNIVLGLEGIFQNAMPYTPHTLQYMAALLPEGAIFTVSAAGPQQTRALTHALILGGHVRVGIEDHPYDTAGNLAPNARLVEHVVGLVRALGLEPATAAEARSMLGLTAGTRLAGEKAAR
jgi:3-keto-5-aminohexanoate cleavage enzyme